MPINLKGDRQVEWSWVASRIPQGPGTALDFGIGGSPLALVAAYRGFTVTALDREPIEWPYCHPGLVFVRGDLFDVPMSKGSFDLIINCSTIEHVGLVGRYSVSDARPDGDLEAMRILRSILKPGGRMLMTVPVGHDAVFSPACRVYGFQRLPRLIDGFTILEESYWTKNDQNRWIESDRDTALDSEAHAGSFSPLQTLYGLGFFTLVRDLSR